ncbi:MAG: hypothetical protein JO004_06315 [Methylobacteriaceae bacterium]|nr:hypothetical protein [Methylobacteriaceae bacterium]
MSPGSPGSMVKSLDGVAFWASTFRPTWGQTVEVLDAIKSRWSQYDRSNFDRTISPVDDMLEGDEARDYYFAVGRSALDVISEAMMLSGRTRFERVLDLPCGGGRVTRHLVKFLPDAEVFGMTSFRKNERPCAINSQSRSPHARAISTVQARFASI